MIPLVWKMNKQRGMSKKTGGIILLLLVLLIAHSLKLASVRHYGGATFRDKNLFVQIVGDINSPGVYSFSKSPDLKELIEKAGGLKSNRGGQNVFRDSSIPSGTKVTVLWNGKELLTDFGNISSFHKLTLGIPISINEESEEGLTAISGIGPSLARNIIEEKHRRGGFKRLSDLLAVHGIGYKLYNRIAPLITL